MYWRLWTVVAFLSLCFRAGQSGNEGETNRELENATFEILYLAEKASPVTPFWLDGKLSLDVNLVEAARLYEIAKQRGLDDDTTQWTKSLDRVQRKIAGI